MAVRIICVAIVASLLAAQALAQTPHPRAAEIAGMIARLNEAVGGPAALQKVYDDARSQQARIDGALALAAALEPAFRAGTRPEIADQIAGARAALAPLQEPMRQRYQKLAALDTALDEAAAQAAYDRTWAIFAAALKQPAVEQYKVFVAEGALDSETVKTGQMVADLILAAAEGKANPQ